MRFLAALFLAVAALTSPALAQLDTANVQRTEAIGCRLGKRTGEGLGQLVSFRHTPKSRAGIGDLSLRVRECLGTRCDPLG
jgi:hypothetical protein